jgi:hypothetical protein
MDKVDTFINLFSDFELVVEAKRGITDQNPTRMALDSTNKSRSELKKALKRLTQEYKHAQKSFKANKINKQELFDFEWRIFEIQEELRKIEESGIDNRFETDQDI